MAGTIRKSWGGSEGKRYFFKSRSPEPCGSAPPRRAYRLPVYMLGEVRKPGEYTLNPDSDFLDSLVQAGGFTERADLNNIEIIRRLGGRKQVYDFAWSELQSAPTPLQGDVVFVHADTTTRFEKRTLLLATIISALASIVTSSVLVLAYNKGRI